MTASPAVRNSQADLGQGCVVARRRQRLLRMLDEDQRVPDVEPESPATVGDQSQDFSFVCEAAAQQNEPGLEVVLDIWQLEALVEANLAVRELDALLAVVK